MSTIRKTCLLAGAASLALTGCATKVPERDRGVHVGAQGASSEVVFSGAGVVSRLGGHEPGWEYARRDATLSGRQRVVATATNQWPAQARPSLDRARRLYLRSNTRSILYFNQYGPPTGGSYIGRPFY